MKRILKNTVFAVIVIGAAACSNESTFDASGSFEAVETIISAEATGTLKAFQVEEGQTLEAGQQVGYVDTVQLYLKKKQLESQMEALAAKKPNIPVQLSAFQEQLKTAETEKKRIENLVKSDAATTKQLDDVNAQIAIIKKQIDAQKSTLEISSTGINSPTLFAKSLITSRTVKTFPLCELENLLEILSISNVFVSGS